jgi:uroporphyrinogen-III C-methyltransferase (EC 2.1.1.107)/precorrin-2 dehydrogenase (EC 1.3.1.76)
MALVGARHLSEQLIAHGMRGDMPVALVEKGQPHQIIKFM